MYVCMDVCMYLVIKYIISEYDQPGKVANPARRGQLNRGK